MGRPKKYFNEEDRMKAYHQSKNKYMVKKEWRCPDCENRNYTDISWKMDSSQNK